MPNCIYRAFFDRNVNSIEGLFTVIDTKKGNKVFNRLPARSGQAGYTNDSWYRGKGPIPFSKELGRTELMIHMKRPQNFEQWPDKPGGIGEFWSISNSPTDTQTIQSPTNSKLQRIAVGLHPENTYKGSAGCIVLLHDTQEQEQELIRLHYFLLSLLGIYDYLPLTVL